MIHPTTIKRFRPLLCLLIAGAGVFFGSCNQNSIFYDISIEPDPQDPIIKGMPASLVLLNDRIYAASLSSNTIWEYSSGKWVKTPLDPGGSIRGMAGTKKYLYVLIFTTQRPESARLKRIDLTSAPAEWEEISREETESNYSRLQSVYYSSKDETVFLGAQQQGDERKFAIFYVDGNNKRLSLLKENTALLQGAAWDEKTQAYYLATAGNGIFKVPESLSGSEPMQVSLSSLKSETLLVMGIMKVGETIMAVTKDTYLFYLEGTKFKTIRTAGASNLTGAMGIWREPNGTRTLLLLGAQGNTTSLTHGYREVSLKGADATGGLGNVMTVDEEYGTLTLMKPGAGRSEDWGPSTTDNEAKYEASIGIHPVLTILQTPENVEPPPQESDDWEPVIFAGTSKNGLWSYRNKQWNAEEE
jgi:hypothetical protein